MRPVLICLIMVCFLGCHSSGKPEKPDNLIAKEKMVDILYDVFVLNAAKGSNKRILENNGIYPENFVFEKHGIDSAQFAESNAYYGFYVEDYEAIINDVEQRINLNKDNYQKLVDIEDKKKLREKDSLRRIMDSVKMLTTKKKPTEKKPTEMNPTDKKPLIKKDTILNLPNRN